MCSATRPATPRRATLACLAIACALIALTLAAPIGQAAAGQFQALTGWGPSARLGVADRSHRGRKCHAKGCCRNRRPQRRSACARTASSPQPAPVGVDTASGQATSVADGNAAAAVKGSAPVGEPRSEGPVPAPEPPADEGGDPVEEEIPPSDGEEPVDEGEEPDEGEGPGDEDEAGAGEAPVVLSENPPPAASPSAPEPLTWAPPPLVNPKTIELGTGYTHTSLSTSRDYIVKLPPSEKVGGTWLDGGHNVVLIGGAVTIPAGTDPGNRNDAQRRAIYIRGATGTVHIEGVRIDGSGGGEMDGVDIAAPEATVQLENLRIEGVRGGYSSFHADLVQPWGGVDDLRIDRLSGTSNYQGLFLKPDLGPIGSAQILNTDLVASAEGALDRGGTMLWLTAGTNTCSGYPVTLSNVFISPRPGSSLDRAIWPSGNSGLDCRPSGSSLATWPSLAVDGGVRESAPSEGSFVAPGTAGLGYRSPGYATP